MKKKQRIPMLDYLKAIGVLMVILTHYEWESKDNLIFSLVINMAVPIFMIISGYNFSLSFHGKEKEDAKEYFKLSNLMKKIQRFLQPFFIICLLEIILLTIEGKNTPLIRIFFLGAYGPGSYYVPIVVQLLIVFPLLFILVKKWREKGLYLIAGLNLLYELMVSLSGMDNYTYRLLVFRYLLLIGFGCYLWLNPEKQIQRGVLLCCISVGLFYLIYVVTLNHQLPIFQYWTPTALPVAGFICPVLYLVFKKGMEFRLENKFGVLLTQMGKASYHIFLVQMVYYHFELGKALEIYSPLFFLSVHIIICVSIGLSFYELEDKVQNMVGKIRVLIGYVCLNALKRNDYNL